MPDHKSDDSDGAELLLHVQGKQTVCRAELVQVSHVGNEAF